jgi:PGF-pre-PGF domain-containing protein
MFIRILYRILTIIELMKKSLSLTITFILFGVFAAHIFYVWAASFSSSSTPTTLESGASNQQLNFTVENTDSAYNVTQVNITVPSGFVFIADSNSTTASDTLFSNTSINLTWDNTTAIGFIENGTMQYFLFNLTVPSGTGDYNFTVSTLDTSGASNSTNVTITVSDTTDPSDIITVLPTLSNSSYTNVNWFEVNVTFTELNPDTCLLDLDNGTVENHTMAMIGSYACYYNATAQEGEWNYSVWVNDTSGNWGWNGTWFITVDTTLPTFSSHARSPDPPHEDENVMLNVTVTEDSLDTVLLDWNYSTNYTVTTSSGSEYYFTILAGNYTAHDQLNYTWYASDTSGNLNASYLQSFTVANQQPSQPTLTAPSNYANISTMNITFQFSSTDQDDEDTLTYYIFINDTLNDSISSTSIDINFSDGFYNWSVQADDSYQNSTISATRFFTIDTTPPSTDFIPPTDTNGTETENKNYITWNVSVSENVSVCSIEINTTNQTGTTIVNASSSSYCYFNETGLSGNVTRCAIAHAADSFRNWNTTQITICRSTNEQQDIYPPLIIISSPQNTTYNTSTIQLNVSASEPTSTWWYQLDSNGTNETFQPNSTIYTTLEGLNNITVWTNDTTGNENSSKVWFTLDTTPSMITVDSPTNTTYNTTLIDLNVTTGEAAATCTYNLNESINHSLSNDSMTNWFAKITLGSNGLQHLNVYCSDTAGNMNLNSTIWFTKNITEYTCDSCIECSNYFTNFTILGGDTLRLTSDLTETSGHCIVIRERNITLDCDGYGITGLNSGSFDGIRGFYNIENSVIKNCENISYFRYGIYLAGTKNITIYNVSISQTYGNYPGIYLIGVNESNITDFNSTNNFNGIYVHTSYNNSIDNAHITNSREYGAPSIGIEFESLSNYNNVTSSYFINNNYGIQLNTGVSQSNYVYNNFFNQTGNLEWTVPQSFNVTLDCSQTSIIGGPCTGGNYWTSPQGNFSDTCTDADGNGICDSPYNIVYNAWDNLSLTYTIPTINLESPQNSTINATDNTPNFTFNVTGWVSSTYNCTLYLDNGTTFAGGSNDTVNNDTSTAITSSLLVDNTYTWWINCTGISQGRENQSEARTLEIDTTAPTISIYSPANTTYNTSTIQLNVSASEPTSAWWYQLDSNGTNETFQPNSTIYTTLEGLNNITVWANDTTGNENSSTVWFTLDTEPPNILNVTNGTVTSSTAIILWNTSEPSTSVVYYSTNQSNLSSSKSDSSLVTEHSVALSSLTGNSTYYYNASSCDSSGNCNTSATYNFTTQVCIESWSCSEWSECSGGIQTMVCTDQNSCGTTLNKPAESRPCEEEGGGGRPGVIPPTSIIEESHSWTRITPGNVTIMKISNRELGVQEIRISVVNEANSVYIKVMKVEGRPAGIEHSVSGRVYRYLEIYSRNLDQSLENSTIRFSVNKTWISGNSIDRDTVTLNRYTDTWNRLPTARVTENSEVVFYETECPGFSYFAVTGEALQATVCGNGICESGENPYNCPGDCPEQPEGGCTPDARRCMGSYLQQCSSNGTAWETLENCQYGCSQEACLEKPPDIYDYIQDIYDYKQVVVSDYPWLPFAVAAVIITALGAVVIKRRLSRTEAYCLKCKKDVVMKYQGIVSLRSGRKAKKGVCPHCGTEVFRLYRQPEGEQPRRQAYCMRCRKKVYVMNEKTVTLKNGSKAKKGTCPNCSATTFRLLSKEKPH